MLNVTMINWSYYARREKMNGVTGLPTTRQCYFCQCTEYTALTALAQ
jgi:hypothetical protein